MSKGTSDVISIRGSGKANIGTDPSGGDNGDRAQCELRREETIEKKT